MSVWPVRAGRFGENEAKALDEGIATIGWGGLPDELQAELPLKRCWALVLEE